MDNSDIAKSDCVPGIVKSGCKTLNEKDGFVVRINITYYKEKYKMEEPNLIKKPQKQFYEIQEEFLQRGFLEMKNYIQRQIEEHFEFKKREAFYKVSCDINLENVEIESVTLFTVNGEKIESLKDIQPD